MLYSGGEGEGEGSGEGRDTIQAGPHLRPLSFRGKVKATKQFPRNPPPFVRLSYNPCPVTHAGLLCFVGISFSHTAALAGESEMILVWEEEDPMTVRHQRKGRVRSF